MSLLSMLQDVCALGNIKRPTSVIGSTDTQVIQLLALAHYAGKVVRKMYDWPQLEKRASFATVNGTATYALATDFERLISRTAWDTTNHWELVGPLTPQEWEFRKAAIVSTGPRKRFRIWQSATNQISIDPTPTDAATLVYEYISKYWILDSNGATTSSETFTADTETPVFGERPLGLLILAYFFSQKGLDYSFYERDAREMLGKEFVGFKGSRTLNEAAGSAMRWAGPWNVPDTGFGS